MSEWRLIMGDKSGWRGERGLSKCREGGTREMRGALLRNHKVAAALKVRAACNVADGVQVQMRDRGTAGGQRGSFVTLPFDGWR